MFIFHSIKMNELNVVSQVSPVILTLNEQCVYVRSVKSGQSVCVCVCVHLGVYSMCVVIIKYFCWLMSVGGLVGE